MTVPSDVKCMEVNMVHGFKSTIENACRVLMKTSRPYGRDMIGLSSHRGPTYVIDGECESSSDSK